MTLEQLDRIMALRAEIKSTRAKVLDESLPVSERRLEQERLSALTAKLLELEAPPPVPSPTTPLVDPRMSREQAAERAAAIRAMPAFWDAHRRDANGVLVITHADHALLVRELRELDARAAEEP
jgi:hypothetical protein